MVSVSFYPFHQILPPHLRPRATPSPGQSVRPLVIKFINYQDTFLVGQSQECLTIGVMACTDMVKTELFQPVHHAADGRLVGCCTHGAEVVVVGSPLQEDFSSVQPKAVLAGELHRADAEALGELVDGLAAEHQRHLSRVEVGLFAPPQLRVLHRHLRQLHLHRGLLVVLRCSGARLARHLTVGAEDAGLYHEVVLLVLDAFHLYLHTDCSLLFADLRRIDIDAVAGNADGVF